MLDKITKYTDMSLRTVIIACNDIETSYNEKWEDAETVEKDLIVIVIVGIQDPQRKKSSTQLASVGQLMSQQK